MTRLVECVPNFSEGRRAGVIEEIVASITAEGKVKLLDYSLDADYNRAVVTFVGEPEAVKAAAFRGIKKASELIEMEKHQGEHIRIGACDVVPFIPIRGVTMDDCVKLAQDLAKQVGEELQIPAYLYEEAAIRSERRNLAEVRKGQYEQLKEEITLSHRRPDCGPAAMHPKAGAVCIGARAPLIAFNVNLNTSDIKVANSVARAIRARNGGLAYVKAVGISKDEQGIVQVSMNLTNYRRTPLYRAVELIKAEAARYGVSVCGSEIIGLVPQEALLDAAAYYLRIEGFSVDQVLEEKLR